MLVILGLAAGLVVALVLMFDARQAQMELRTDLAAMTTERDLALAAGDRSEQAVEGIKADLAALRVENSGLRLSESACRRAMILYRQSLQNYSKYVGSTFGGSFYLQRAQSLYRQANFASIGCDL